MFLQHLLEQLTALWELLLPWVVVEAYENGVVLRLGRYHRTLTPGFHWKIPLAERYIGTNVVVTTLNLGSQSLTTRDGKGVVVSAIVKYHIADVSKFLLEVNDAADAIADVAMAGIRQVVNRTAWEEFDGDTDAAMEALVRDEVRRWGIEIEPGGLVLTDLQICRSIRHLFSDRAGSKHAGIPPQEAH